MTAVVPAGGQRGTTVDISSVGKPGTAPLSVWTAEPGLKFEPGEKPGQFRVTVSEEARTGTHRFRLYNAEGATAPLVFVVGALPEITETEPNNLVTEAASQELPRLTVNGALAKAADVDIFAVPLKQGQTLVASLLANRDLGSPMDGVLQILSPGGAVQVRNDDDHGLDPQVAFTATEDGTHYVRLFAFPAAPNSSVALSGSATYHYRLTLTSGPFVDYVQPMAIGPQTEQVSVFGWNIPEELRSLPVSRTDDAEETVVSAADLPESVSLPVTAGPALVEAAGLQDGQLQQLTVPSSVTGVISGPGETDGYSLALKKGETIQLMVEARSRYSLLDPLLTIRDAEGKLLKESDDEARNEFDVNLAWTAPADGTYTFQVRDVFRHGGPRYFYRLSVEAVKPDFGLSTEAERFTLTPGTPLEIPVSITRSRLASEISISVRGLPSGLIVPPVTSAGKGDTSKKVTLQLSAVAASAVAGSYPFEVTGLAPEADEAVRTAKSPADAGGYQTRRFWLTVLPVPPVVAPRP
ncbi:MAG: PPC domain-containing protein [Planctomycetaceae bacterium]|nr:PPC domain-containing protein [Planctomycetaceae bacterium]